MVTNPSRRDKDSTKNTTQKADLDLCQTTLVELAKMSFRALAVSAAVLSYVVSYASERVKRTEGAYHPLVDAAQSTAYLKAFYIVAPPLLLLWALWRVFLWPNFVSPLRHLPTVDGGRWLSREALRMYTDPRGVAQCDW